VGPGRIDFVATPIGNLSDLSPRARDALAGADLIAAEDTRHTAALLRHIGVQKPLLSLHEHSETGRVQELLARARGGALVAVVSDAGMPLVSDPGYLLLRAALDGGVAVGAVPGPSAALLALTLSGLPVDRFCFEGFLPTRSAMVFFEAPHRIVETLEDMMAVLGSERDAAVARELTKVHESIYRGTLRQLRQLAGNEANFSRGEITLVVAGTVAVAPDDAFVRRALELLAGELPPARAAAVVAQLTGRHKAEVYALLHQPVIEAT